MTFEQVLIVLFAVLVLINLVASALRRAMHEHERLREDLRVPATPTRRRAVLLEQPPRVGKRLQRVAEPSAPAVQQRRPRPVTLEEARRGMVLMAILGPCRAVDPSIVEAGPR